MTTDGITALMDRGVVTVGLLIFGAVVGWGLWRLDEWLEKKWSVEHPPKHERRGR